MFTRPGLPKLLLLCLVVWLVWRMFNRMNSVARRDHDDGPGGHPGNRPMNDRSMNNRSGRSTNAQHGQPRAVEDMVQCPKCGAYVPAKGGHDCTGSA
jgi:hypothetical protein